MLACGRFGLACPDSVFLVICGDELSLIATLPAIMANPVEALTQTRMIGWPEGAGQPGGPLPVRIQKVPKPQLCQLGRRGDQHDALR